MPVQNSSSSANMLLQDTNIMVMKEVLALKTIVEKEQENNIVNEQAIEILKKENTDLKKDLNSEKIEKETLIQLMENDLQSSKRVLQCVCSIAGAILGGGLVLMFPPAGAAIALAGTGTAVAGVAVAGGAAGGCLVAPIIHKKTNNASIQQVQNFKKKEEDAKKAQANQKSESIISGNN